MNRPRRRKSQPLMLIAIALSGSTLFGGCETIFKDAFVSGTKNYFLTGFLPSLIPTDFVAGDTAETEE